MHTAILATVVSDGVVSILVWGGILILACVALFGGLWYYRQRFLRSEEPTQQTPWTFDDLARMKEAGNLSEEEYRALRAAMIAAFGGRKGPPAAGRPASRPNPGAMGSEGDFELRKGPEA